MNQCRSWGAGKKPIYRSRAPETEGAEEPPSRMHWPCDTSWTGIIHPSTGELAESLHACIQPPPTIIFFARQTPLSLPLSRLSPTASSLPRAALSACAVGRRWLPVCHAPTPALLSAARRPWRAPSSADARAPKAGLTFDARLFFFLKKSG
jgi:hypothetical protein